MFKPINKYLEITEFQYNAFDKDQMNMYSNNSNNPSKYTIIRCKRKLL